MDRILVTGGAGFIGSNFVQHVLAHTDAHVINVDKLTYAGNLDSLAEAAESPRHDFERVDIVDAPEVARVFEQYRPTAVIHLAAESHVDRSITGPGAFIHTNVTGTFTLLEAARKHDKRFHHVSTDEVYGDLELDDPKRFTEDTPYNPSSPYSASKAGSDHLVRAWVRSFGVRATISNCSNNYGPWQHVEKFIPRQVTNVLDGERPKVYGAGTNVRDWIHVDDHCAGIVATLFEGKPGTVYNLGGNSEMVNLDLVRMILDRLGKSHSLISFVPDRLGHDRRYAIDSAFAQRELDWKPLRSFKEGLDETIQWYIDNPSWWQPLLERAGRY